MVRQIGVERHAVSGGQLMAFTLEDKDNFPLKHDGGLAAARLMHWSIARTSGAAPRLETVGRNVGPLPWKRRSDFLDPVSTSLPHPMIPGPAHDHVLEFVQPQQLGEAQIQAGRDLLGYCQGRTGAASLDLGEHCGADATSFGEMPQRKAHRFPQRFDPLANGIPRGSGWSCCAAHRGWFRGDLMGHRVCTLSRTSVLSRRNVWWPSTNPVPLTGTVRGMTTRTAPDVRRQQLLRVAERIFATRPYASVSVQEIADEAGVTRGLIHHYFGNKNGVMAAVIREIAPDRAPAVLPAEGSVRERVEIRVDLLMSVFESHSEAWLATLGLGPSLESPLKEVAEDLWEKQYRIWQATFADVIELNQRTRTLYASYRGFNQATCRQWLGGELSREDAREFLVSTQTALIEQLGPKLT